ncbi:MAG: protein arginine kinase [Mariniblastus sp.]|nr:protein arginine kinase [Mariniblastus sp.]
MLDSMASSCGEWLKGNGPDSDIVMSSRIRLARNLADYPFIKRCTDIDRASIESTVREKLEADERLKKLTFIDVADLENLDRQFLVERQLISRELSDAEGARAVAIDEMERISLMINEEDHLRIQVMKSGFDLQSAWEQINRVDDLIEERLNYAFHKELGYLTACPTNVGTGMRVSVLVHLPALVITKHIEKVFRTFQRINLVVRGLYGEGSQAMGDFYQVSNQITLGKSEDELVKQVGDVVPVLINYERKARDFLISGENQHNLFDQVSRAYGTLQNAQQISSEETMYLLSQVRMGVNLGLIGDLEIPTINKLFIHTQPAHLQKLRRSELDTMQRNIERANYLQQHLKSDTEDGPEMN